MSPYIGRSVQRLEDVRFLTGRGRYLADIDCPGALWGHVLRSPHAHALIKRIDAAAAAAVRRRARRLHRRRSRRPRPDALPGGGIAADRAAAPRAGCRSRAPCRRSGGVHRRRQRGDRARSRRARRDRLRGAAVGRRWPCGARRRRAVALAPGAAQHRVPHPEGRCRCGGASDEGRGAHRRDRRDEQSCRGGADRAPRRHRALRRGDRHASISS